MGPVVAGREGRHEPGDLMRERGARAADWFDRAGGILLHPTSLPPMDAAGRRLRGDHELGPDAALFHESLDRGVGLRVGRALAEDDERLLGPSQQVERAPLRALVS